MVSNWFRCNEYAFLHRDPASPLGKELVWIEGGVSYVLKVEDVPVKVDCWDNKKSLQKAKGVGVISSIDKLKLEQIDDKRYRVSIRENIFNPETDVRLVTPRSYELYFNMTFPVCLPADGWKVDKKRFDKNATGWHGSIGLQIKYLSICGLSICPVVYAAVPWSKESMVAVVSRVMATQRDTINNANALHV